MKLSIITPSYHQASFIERTIQSVLSQGIPVEYWVLDGGSTDGTQDILKKYENKLQWVSEKDNGQADAVNKGLKKATGDIIGWLNSDDIYYPNALKNVLAFFEANPNIDIIYGNANHIDSEDHILEPYPIQPWDLEALKTSCFICQPAVFFRRRLIEKHGFLDIKLNYCMDYEYWLRLSLAGVALTHVPVLLAGSRLHADAKTVNQALAANKDAQKMLKVKLGYVPESFIRHYVHLRFYQNNPNPSFWCRFKGALLQQYLRLRNIFLKLRKPYIST